MERWQIPCKITNGNGNWACGGRGNDGDTCRDRFISCLTGSNKISVLQVLRLCQPVRQSHPVKRLATSCALIFQRNEQQQQQQLQGMSAFVIADPAAAADWLPLTTSGWQQQQIHYNL